jgi:hypothetical protein
MRCAISNYKPLENSIVCAQWLENIHALPSHVKGMLYVILPVTVALAVMANERLKDKIIAFGEDVTRGLPLSALDFDTHPVYVRFRPCPVTSSVEQGVLIAPCARVRIDNWIEQGPRLDPSKKPLYAVGNGWWRLRMALQEGYPSVSHRGLVTYATYNSVLNKIREWDIFQELWDTPEYALARAVVTQGSPEQAYVVATCQSWEDWKDWKENTLFTNRYIYSAYGVEQAYGRCSGLAKSEFSKKKIATGKAAFDALGIDLRPDWLDTTIQKTCAISLLRLLVR